MIDNKVITVDLHVILAKSKKRIAVAAEAMRYYSQVGRYITPTNMHWKTLTNFDIHWNVLNDLKKQGNPDVPKLTINGSIIKWIEYFKLHSNAFVGVRNCPMVYVMCE